MADVYLAVARGPVGFNKLVVVKRLRAQLADEAAFRQMFLDEARLAARLNHPNIVQTFEVGEESGVHYIAMEYLEGQPVNKLLRESLKQNRPIPQTLAARLVADSLSGLSYAHTLRDYDGSPLGIIHRDVSPHNIFVTYEGQVKLVDFGIAKATSATTETEVGVLKGKVAYMAPEQALGGAVDARADIFASGIVLWELLTRQRLLPGDNAAVTLHRLMNQPIPRVSDVMPDVHPMLDGICARALERDPNLRFSSASEMREALEHFIMEASRQTGVAVRNDDLGAMLSQMFAATREEVQSKVRVYMAQFQRPSAEIQSLGVDSLSRLGPIASGVGSSASLLRLGSGSASLAHQATFPPQDGSMRMSGSVSALQPQVAAQPQQRSLVVPIVLGGCFLLASVALAVFGLRRHDPQGTPPQTTTGSSAAGQGTGRPTNIDSVGPAQTGSTPVAVTLTAPTGTGPQTPNTRGTPTPNVWPNPRHSSPVSSSKPSSEPSGQPSAATDPGFLTLNTYPFTRVSEGGRSLGVTPLVRVSLSPGAHTLTLENSEQGIKESTTVVIKSGETTTKQLAFK
jgi:serine/threonine-protein kinase